MYHEAFCCSCQLPAPFPQYMNNYLSSAANKAPARTSIDPPVFAIILFICHAWSRHTGRETAMKTRQQTPTMHLRAKRATLQRKEAITRPSFGTCRSHCLGGDERPPSRPQPTTAQTNYLTGSFCIHGGPRDRTRPVFYLFLIHQMAVAHKAFRVS